MNDYRSHIQSPVLRWIWTSCIERSMQRPDIANYLEFDSEQLSKPRLRARMQDGEITESVLRDDVTYRVHILPRLTKLNEAQNRRTLPVGLSLAQLLLVWVVALLFILMNALAYPAYSWWGAILINGITAAFTYLILKDEERRRGVSRFIRGTWHSALYGYHLMQLAIDAVMWRSSFEVKIAQAMRREIVQMLGPEHDTLLVFQHNSGLTYAHHSQFWVTTDLESDFKRKLDQMDGGAIAICGPRGVGKSTLLRKACEGTLDSTVQAPNFHVTVQTPANYRPEEFLVSLFQQVCRSYLALYGHRARGPFIVRTRIAGVLRRVSRALPGWVYLILGLAGLGLALWGPTRDAYAWVATEFVGTLTSAWHTVTGTIVNWWKQHPFISRVVLVSVSLILVARSRVLGKLFRRRYRRHRALLAECNNYLSLLQYTQNASNATTLGLPGVVGVTLGGSRTTGVSSRALSYPELVSHFCGLLTRIGSEERNYKWKVFLGIDELDRLGSVEQVKSFLAEIKAIFAIPGVYFLLTVSEDIGAAFMQRGIPSRDITASSLEAVQYVSRRDLSQATELLQQRVPGFRDPFVALVHALAGGIPRDLIRYARKMVEIRHRIQSAALIPIAATLLFEEISQALSSFRLLLGESTHTAEHGRKVHTLYTITNLIRQANATDLYDIERVEMALATLISSNSTLSARAENAPDVWEDVSTYALFAVTLLQVFVQSEFPRRAREQEERGHSDGDLDVLAAIRLELEISRSSAHLMTERFRSAWDLRLAPDPNLGSPRS
ncbi:hypothetical protein [Streptomyces sp. NRRL B-3229]|uniref:hypothetical protein n=1 Tax=Streptomyces sp. NRRL B-3229 TaxID=1463836 RepID=UPI000AE46F4E|nr:hypothetical protein [Streptomyces sp. NRRL B-3229]